MMNRKAEYHRLLQLAAEEEAAAARAHYNDPLQIDTHRARARNFRDAAGRFAFKPRKDESKVDSST